MWVDSLEPSRILHLTPRASAGSLPEASNTQAIPMPLLGQTQKGPSFRKRVASTALKALRSSGAFSMAARSERRRNSLLILCYHGIALHDEHKWWPHLYITPEHFRGRLQCLRDAGASVLPLDEALNRLEAGSLPKRSISITFDDGFCDFLEHGVPILSEFQYPCTLYLTTHYCDYPFPITSLMLDYLLWKSGRAAICYPELGIEALCPSGLLKSGKRL